MFSQFKNATTYLFGKEFKLDLEKLESQLGEFKSTPLEDSSRLIRSLGFCSPLGLSNGSLAHSGDGITALSVKIQKRLIPAKVLKREFEKARREKEKELERPVKKGESTIIREAVLLKLIPQSFVEEKNVGILILDDRIIVGSGSNTECDDVTSLLRKAVGSLPIRPVYTLKSFDQVATNQIRKQVDDANNTTEELSEANQESKVLGFDLGEKVTLKHVVNPAQISMKNIAIDSAEFAACVDAMMVTMAELGDEFAWFSLTDSLQLKTIAWRDSVKFQNDDIEDQLARKDADMVLCAAELKRIMDKIISELGGLPDAE